MSLMEFAFICKRFSCLF